MDLFCEIFCIKIDCFFHKFRNKILTNTHKKLKKDYLCNKLSIVNHKLSIINYK